MHIQLSKPLSFPWHSFSDLPVSSEVLSDQLSPLPYATPSSKTHILPFLFHELLQYHMLLCLQLQCLVLQHLISLATRDGLR